MYVLFVFFFKQKTAYEMRISDWSSDVCSSDLLTPTIGRSHGIHAEPVTFGLKLAEAYAEFSRCKTRLIAARAEIATCAISGAVGPFANIDPRVEAPVAATLGLAIEPVSTPVIPRERHAMFLANLGGISSCDARHAVANITPPP